MKNEEDNTGFQAPRAHHQATCTELVYDGDFAAKFNSNRMLNVGLDILGVSVCT